MTRGGGASAALIVALFATAFLSGCFGSDEKDDALFAPLDSLAPPYLTVDLPIHVVLVGFSEEFEGAKLVEGFPATQWRVDAGSLGTTGAVDWEHLLYRLHYDVTRASAGFEKAFFDKASELSRFAPPDGWLQAYDRDVGGKRLCDLCPDPGPASPLGAVTSPQALANEVEEPRPIQQVDAMALEDWISESGAARGLDRPGYTYFLVDSWTTKGLPTDTYHQYWFEDGVNLPANYNMRAWGGRYDFVWLDVGAGPSGYDYEPWPIGERVGDADPPVWETGYSEDFLDKQRQDLWDAIDILWTKVPIYDYAYAPRLEIPLHLFVDENAHLNRDHPLYAVAGDDPAEWVKAEDIQAAYARLLPWVEVAATQRTYFLPNDAPDVAAALRDAKAYGPEGAVSLGVMHDFFDDTWEQWTGQPESPRMDAPGDTIVLPQFFFLMEGGTTFDSPLGGYGVSLGNQWGDSWGVITNFGDVYPCPSRAGRLPEPSLPVCFMDDRAGDSVRYFLGNFLNHEGGHSVGLPHTHDTVRYDNDTGGLGQYYINWLWDSTWSAMTYRHYNIFFDQFDQDGIARGQAAFNVGRTVHLLEHLDRETDGGSGLSSAGRDAVETALSGVAIVQGRLDALDWKGAVAASIGALNAAQAAVDAAGGVRHEEHEVEKQEKVLQLSSVPAESPVASPDTCLLVTVEPGAEYFKASIQDQASGAQGAGHGAWLGALNDKGELIAGSYYDFHDKMVLRDLPVEGGIVSLCAFATTDSPQTYDLTVEEHRLAAG